MGCVSNVCVAIVKEMFKNLTLFHKTELWNDFVIDNYPNDLPKIYRNDDGFFEDIEHQCFGLSVKDIAEAVCGSMGYKFYDSYVISDKDGYVSADDPCDLMNKDYFDEFYRWLITTRWWNDEPKSCAITDTIKALLHRYDGMKLLDLWHLWVEHNMELGNKVTSDVLENGNEALDSLNLTPMQLASVILRSKDYNTTSGFVKVFRNEDGSVERLKSSGFCINLIDLTDDFASWVFNYYEARL